MITEECVKDQVVGIDVSKGSSIVQAFVKKE
ncbi:hypothetical protein BBR47_30130 [Brevibacillus brevis NBRC 100599]|uniref:Uncharacterized protein n=1 Tax=Brevibacillus brevis (strain 47 / JCM 6285 / NBRC 100599) TaxID=358681 RepID=C0ZDY1_BREBN|nr:hypothetical protein BBR47_30130 [Brevibacillus brevis NBRC 100599]